MVAPYNDPEVHLNHTVVCLVVFKFFKVCQIHGTLHYCTSAPRKFLAISRHDNSLNIFTF